MNPPEALLQAAIRDTSLAAAMACADWYEEHEQPEQARLMRLALQVERESSPALGGVAAESSADAEADSHHSAMPTNSVEAGIELVHLARVVRWKRALRQPEPGDLHRQHGVLVDTDSTGSGRGLPKFVNFVESDQLAEIATRWFDQVPVRGISVQGIGPNHLRKLLRSPLVPRIARLSLAIRDGTQQHARCLPMIADVAETMQPISMHLWDQETMLPTMDYLATMRQFGKVRRLTLESVSHQSAAIHGLLTAPHWRGLQRLCLRALRGHPRGISLQDLRTWGDANSAAPLREWTTRHCSYQPGALAAFAESGRWESLTHLGFFATTFKPGDAADLAAVLARGTLRSLQLHDCTPTTPEFLQQLFSPAESAASPGSGLRQLQFRVFNGVGDCFAALARWPGLRTVQEASLQGNFVQDGSLRAFCQSEYAQSLIWLSLSGVAGKQLEELVDAFPAGRLRSLSLSIMSLAGKPVNTLERVLNSPGLRQLRSLTISCERVEPFVRCLFSDVQLPELVHLHLLSSSLSSSARDLVMLSPNLPKLSWLTAGVQGEHVPGEQLPPGWIPARPAQWVNPERLA
ncbi:hypothetical protein [Tuwongella immobilis]|uniref:Repeat-companion domain protein n=1 Tax=Tuwongella immobilis TaxID=692036 RepID=A0A6C2YU64_9BACT|nr:hypothetical protein [Tuwongella immobilis]VIP04964.1 unnamed protein product [Tuwongella immobilis]VTS07286.1 unnamed protein product [Tuwongella immobilis]